MSSTHKLQWPTVFFRFTRNQGGRFASRDLSWHHPGSIDHPPQYWLWAGGWVTSSIWPLCWHHSAGRLCPFHWLASSSGKPRCIQFRDRGYDSNQAVIIAFLLATIDLLRRASCPGTWVLQETPDGSYFVPEEADHVSDTSGIIIYRFGAPLYFANATYFEEEVEKLITRAASPVKWFVLDVEAMVDIDTSGEEALRQVLTSLVKHGVTVAVSRANQSTTALFSRYHLLELIGGNRLYPTNRHVIEAFRRETGQSTPETTVEK